MIGHKKQKIIYRAEDIPPCREPPNERGSYWRAVDHAHLARLVNQQVRELDWDVHRCAYCTFDQNRAVVGTVQVGVPRAPKTLGSYYLGFVNSNNQRTALTFYAGISREGAPVTQRKWKGTRHTSTTERVLPDLVRGALLSFRRELGALAEEREQLRYFKPTWQKTQELLGISEEGGIIPWRNLRPLVRWLRMESEPPTGWELLEAFGEMSRNRHSPRVQLDVGVRFYDLVRSEVLSDG